MWKTIYKVMDKGGYVKDTDISKINSFLFLKWLGNNPKTIFVSNELNKYYNIPVINQYKMVKDAYAGKKIYIQYPKTNKESYIYKDALAWYFKINPNTAPQYQEFLSPLELENILELYTEMKEHE